MSEPFKVPVEFYYRHRDLKEPPAVLVTDIQAIVRQEVEQFREVLGLAFDSEYEKRAAIYLRLRFGFPEAAPETKDTGCKATTTSANGLPRSCRLTLGHEGDHVSYYGHAWPNTPSAPAERCDHGRLPHEHCNACERAGARPEREPVQRFVTPLSAFKTFTQCEQCSQWYGGDESGHTCKRLWMAPAEREFLRALAKREMARTPGSGWSAEDYAPWFAARAVVQP